MAHGFLQSLQTGTVAITNGNATATASLSPAVNVNNAWLIPMGYTSTEAAGALTDFNAFITLTNATTVTGTRTGTTQLLTPRFALLEFVPGVVRSIQYGTVVLTTVASATATIAAVMAAKTIVTPLGFSTNAGTGGIAGSQCDLDVVLTNPTTITVTGNNSVNTYTVGFVAVELY
jgi:hypothetical protein